MGLDPSNCSKNSHLPPRQVRRLYHWTVLVSTPALIAEPTHSQGSRLRVGERVGTVWHDDARLTSSERPRARTLQGLGDLLAMEVDRHPELSRFLNSSGSDAVLASVPAERVPAEFVPAAAARPLSEPARPPSRCPQRFGATWSSMWIPAGNFNYMGSPDGGLVALWPLREARTVGKALARSILQGTSGTTHKPGKAA